MAKSKANPVSDKVKGQAYTAAQRALRAAHQDEFNTYLQAEYAKVGFKWSPRLTEEQQAAKQMEELLDKFPGLANDIILRAAQDRLAAEEPDEPVEEVQAAFDAGEKGVTYDPSEDFESNDYEEG